MIGPQLRFLYWHSLRYLLYSSQGWNQYIKELFGVNDAAKAIPDKFADVYNRSWTFRQLIFNNGPGLVDHSQNPYIVSWVGLGQTFTAQSPDLYLGINEDVQGTGVVDNTGSLTLTIANNTTGETRNLVVQANVFRTRSPVTVSPGDSITVTATGMWNYNPGTAPDLYADGKDVHGVIFHPNASSNYVMPGQPEGSLVAYVGTYDTNYGFDSTLNTYAAGNVDFCDADGNVLATARMTMPSTTMDDRFDMPNSRAIHTVGATDWRGSLDDQWNGFNPEYLDCSCVSPKMHAMIKTSGRLATFRFTACANPDIRSGRPYQDFDVVAHGTIGYPGSGCDMEVSNLDIIAGEIIRISSLKIRIDE